MPSMRPLDPAFPIERQIAIEASSVVLANVFTLDKADEQIFLQAWQDDAQFMKRQPGFISAQLHRAIGESPTYLNYAVWESTADFRSCVHASGIQGENVGLSVLGGRFPASVPEGRSSGVCVA